MSVVNAKQVYVYNLSTFQQNHKASLLLDIGSNLPKFTQVSLAQELFLLFVTAPHEDYWFP